MAVTKGDYLRIARSLISGSIPTLSYPETTGSTWGVGEVVNMSSGRLVIATAAKVAAGEAFGVTCTTGKAVTSGDAAIGQWDSTTCAQITPCVGWLVYEVAVVHSTTASSVIKNSQIGTAYCLKRSSTLKIWYLSVGSTSSPSMIVIGFRDATGTQNGHVYGVFNTSARHAAWKV